MKNTIWNKRIPTFLGILFLTIAVGITSFLAQRGIIFIGQAGPSETPQNVRITNISDSSFNVSFTTDSKVIGSINFGKDKNTNQIALDDRNNYTSLNSHKVHSITLKNLDPEVKYFFSITSGQNNYLNQEALFNVTTGPILTQTNSAKRIISGKVVLPNGSPPEEGILFIMSNDSQILSSRINDDGTYSIDLTSLRSKDLSTNFPNIQISKIKILVISDSLQSNVITSFQNSIPTIILSKNYDFSISKSPVASSSAVLENFPIFTNSQNGITPKIVTPKEGEEFSDPKPLFKGTGVPNQSVKITIESVDKIETTVNINSSGNWSYYPIIPLSPGKHVISIITKDASGILRTITKNFVVFAAENQVTQPITPSGETTPNPTPSPSPSSTPASTPIIITPMPSPTVLNLILPTPTSLTIASLPVTGTPAVFAGLIGIGVTLAGAVLFILGRGILP